MPTESSILKGWTLMKKISLIIPTVLLAAVIVLSSVQIGWNLYRGKREQTVFDELAERVRQTGITALTSEIDTSPATGTHPNTASSTMPIIPDESVGTTEKPAVHKRNLAPLFAENPDCIGWLTVPGTGIDYPVMHTPGDPQKYLRKDFYGKNSSAGVPFLDARCGADSGNLILYGHNMKNGTMFGTLGRYTDKSYLAGHPVIEFETKSGCVRYAVFAVVSVMKTDEWYGFIAADTREDYDRQIENLLKKALLTTDNLPVFRQRLLTLSTCYGSGKDGRLLIAAVAIQS